jgi:hypothetical protein
MIRQAKAGVAGRRAAAEIEGAVKKLVNTRNLGAALVSAVGVAMAPATAEAVTRLGSNGGRYCYNFETHNKGCKHMATFGSPPHGSVAWIHQNEGQNLFDGQACINTYYFANGADHTVSGTRCVGGGGVAKSSPRFAQGQSSFDTAQVWNGSNNPGISSRIWGWEWTYSGT